jgi:2-polyprenyl-3-methyl-5-hydroxy-6-metoxy-1,4-benzoquinol methylase
METITTIEGLDQKIAECHRAAAISDAALRDMFQSFNMAPVGVDLDPFSEKYLLEQMNLYQQIAGKPYKTENEAYPVDATKLEKVFPYSTQSPRLIGSQYAAIAALLSQMHIAPPARVIEFGAGWGNMALALAQSGYDVTTVDIEESFCRLVQKRAAQLNVKIRSINDDFLLSETLNEKFDAAIFFECFHHCADHRRLLRALHRIIKPGGHLYFIAEPITPKFPVPWGVRLDGESLWAIRHHGWLELGFQEDYFREALGRSGWQVTHHPTGNLTTTIWEAQLDADNYVDTGDTIVETARPNRNFLGRLRSKLFS